MGPCRLLSASLVAAAFASAGCGHAAPPRDPDTLVFAVRADVTGFFPNPPVSNEGYTIDINWNIIEGLVRFNSRLELEPALAERWENPDDRTYVFSLRKGLRFSNGRPVRAEDVVASLTAAQERRLVTRGYLQAVESVRADGPDRVVIRTRFPYLILLFKLPWGLVLPADSLNTSPAPVVGTGPYLLESWQPGREFVLARNPHYRGSPASFARARFVVVPDDEARIGMLLRGEADLADQVPLESLDRLRGRGDVTVFSGPANRVLFLALRVDTPPFADPAVREAVELALDREELIRRALAGRSEAASQVVPPAIVGYNPALVATRPDRVRARKLLADAGHPEGFAIRLDGPRNRYTKDRQILEEVARQLGEVGIRAEVNALDKRDFFALVDRGASKMHLLGWACQTGEAGDALDALFHSTTSGGYLGTENTTGLADPELDRLIEASNRSAVAAERRALLQSALARVAALRPVIPLVVQTEAVAVSRRVRWIPPVNYSLRLDLMERAP